MKSESRTKIINNNVVYWNSELIQNVVFNLKLLKVEFLRR